MENSNKTLLTVLTLLVLMWFLTSLIGCGFQRALRTHCKIGDEQMCDELFGVNQYEIDAAQDKATEDLAREVESIKSTLDMLIKESESYATEIKALKAIVQLLRQDLDANYDYIISLNEDIMHMQEQVNNQQVIINNHQAELVQLSMQDSIIEMYDPCGDGAGFDEVLLKTKSGKLIAYFESGSNRFLTVLQKNTSYRTTDNSRCYFTLNNDGQVVNEHY